MKMNIEMSKEISILHFFSKFYLRYNSIPIIVHRNVCKIYLLIF